MEHLGGINGTGEHDHVDTWVSDQVRSHFVVGGAHKLHKIAWDTGCVQLVDEATMLLCLLRCQAWQTKWPKPRATPKLPCES